MFTCPECRYHCAIVPHYRCPACHGAIAVRLTIIPRPQPYYRRYRAGWPRRATMSSTIAIFHDCYGRRAGAFWGWQIAGARKVRNA